MKDNVVGWFEIPVTDMERAAKFYEAVFEIKIQLQDFQDVQMGWFPFNEAAPGAAGALVKHADYIPSESQGVLIYFSATDIISELSSVKAAGGKVLQEKTLISEDIGYMALFLDLEGNRIALHCAA